MKNMTEAHDRIDALEKENAELKERLEAIEAKLIPPPGRCMKKIKGIDHRLEIVEKRLLG